MMCKCWEEEPYDRPSFDELSDFLAKLLNGQTTPAAGSDEAAGYVYAREATKHIPEDYIDVNTVIEDDDYITVLSTPATKSHASTVVVSNDYVNAPRRLDV